VSAPASRAAVGARHLPPGSRVASAVPACGRPRRGSSSRALVALRAHRLLMRRRGAAAGDEAASRHRAGAGPGVSPSRWSERLPLAAAAGIGCAIASYLALVQLDAIRVPWDPLFSPASSLRVLKSAFSRSLPVPDALVGALAYAAELGACLFGGRDRYRTRPWIVLVYGAIAAALAAGSIVLILVQAVVIRAWCALCLASAGLSIVIALAAEREVRAAWREVRGRRRHGAGAGAKEANV
jgi:uncharacterized membrane protein